MKRAIVIVTIITALAVLAAAVIPALAAGGCSGSQCTMSAKQCPMGKSATSGKAACPMTGKTPDAKKPGKCPFMNGKTAKATVKPAAKKTVSAVCPVMGNKIPDVTKAAGKSVYKGKTYYFCCGMCKPKFDKNPGQYVKNPAKK